MQMLSGLRCAHLLLIQAQWEANERLSTSEKNYWRRASPMKNLTVYMHQSEQTLQVRHRQRQLSVLRHSLYKLEQKKQDYGEKQMRKVGMLMVTALAASLLAGCGYKASDKRRSYNHCICSEESESGNGGTDRRVSENTRKCKCTGKL